MAASASRAGASDSHLALASEPSLGGESDAMLGTEESPSGHFSPPRASLRDAGESKTLTDRLAAPFVATWKGLLFIFTKMDTTNRVLLGFFLAAVLGLMVTDGRRALLVPLALLPVIISFMGYRAFRPSTGAERLDNLVFRIFALGALLGYFVALFMETLLTASFVAVCFSENAVREARDAFRARFTGESNPVGIHLSLSISTFVFLILTSFVASGLVEEGVKLLFVRFNCCGDRPVGFFRREPWSQPRDMLTPRVTLLMLVFVSLGISTMENMLYTLEDGGHSLGRGAATALSRAAVSTPLHMIAGALTASQLARRDFELNAEKRLSWFTVLAPATVYHAVFDFSLLVFPLLMKELLDATEMWVTLVNFVIGFAIVAIGYLIAARHITYTLEVVIGSVHQQKQQRVRAQRRRVLGDLDGAVTGAAAAASGGKVE